MHQMANLHGKSANQRPSALPRAIAPNATTAMTDDMLCLAKTADNLRFHYTKPKAHLYVL
jgi:hypothetical protein